MKTLSDKRFWMDRSQCMSSRSKSRYFETDVQEFVKRLRDYKWVHGKLKGVGIITLEQLQDFYKYLSEQAGERFK